MYTTYRRDFLKKKTMALSFKASIEEAHFLLTAPVSHEVSMYRKETQQIYWCPEGFRKEGWGVFEQNWQQISVGYGQVRGRLMG